MPVSCLPVPGCCPELACSPTLYLGDGGLLLTSCGSGQSPACAEHRQPSTWEAWYAAWQQQAPAQLSCCPVSNIILGCGWIWSPRSLLHVLASCGPSQGSETCQPQQMGPMLLTGACFPFGPGSGRQQTARARWSCSLLVFQAQRWSRVFFTPWVQQAVPDLGGCTSYSCPLQLPAADKACWGVTAGLEADPCPIARSAHHGAWLSGLGVAGVSRTGSWWSGVRLEGQLLEPARRTHPYVEAHDCWCLSCVQPSIHT